MALAKGRQMFAEKQTSAGASVWVLLAHRCVQDRYQSKIFTFCSSYRMTLVTSSEGWEFLHQALPLLNSHVVLMAAANA
jgi:hypothetical protein